MVDRVQTSEINNSADINGVVQKNLSVYLKWQKAQRAVFIQTVRRGSWMSSWMNHIFTFRSCWNELSVERQKSLRFHCVDMRVSNQGFSCIENYEAAASAKFCAASGCRQNSGRQSRASVTEQCPLELLVHIWKNTDIFIQVYLIFLYTKS